MDIREITETLLHSAGSRRGKFVPWWEDDFESCDYRDRLFPVEEVHEIEEAISACGTDTLSAPIGEEGYSLFHLLVWMNFYTAAERALKAGVDANVTDGGGIGVTPLLFACCRGNFTMAKLLTDYGANRAHCDAKGRNGFHYLAHPYAKGLVISEDPIHSLNQRKDIAELLAGSAAKKDSPKTQMPDAPQIDAQAGTAASSAPANINQKDMQGIAPLVYLVDGGGPAICATLIDTYLNLGADPYFIDDNGGTLLFRAILHNRATPALRLMEYPELVAQKTKDGKTVLMQAAEKSLEGLCIALKDHGAEGDFEEFDDINLARLANNAFTDAFGCHKSIDDLALGFYFTKKLLALAQEDEDYGCLERILNNALEDESARVLDLLHDAGVDFNEPYYGGCNDVNCLRDKCMECAKTENVVRKLADLGVDMNRTVIEGRHPAAILASSGHCGGEVFRLFSVSSMEERDNSGLAAIHYAAIKNEPDMLAVMLEQGVDANLMQDAPAEAGDTPLHLACLYGNIENAKQLMAFSADDTIKNINGETPAHKLLLRNVYHRELTTQERKELFSVLEHVDIAGNDGETPLLLLMSWELARSDVEVAELLPILLKKGADVNRRNNAGKTALLLCAENLGRYLKQLNMVKMLCEAGADFNAVDSDGNNVLYYVFQSGGQNVAKYLLKKGADYMHPNNKGVTPAQVAAEKGYDTLFALMPDMGMA